MTLTAFNKISKNIATAYLSDENLSAERIEVSFFWQFLLLNDMKFCQTIKRIFFLFVCTQNYFLVNLLHGLFIHCTLEYLNADVIFCTAFPMKIRGHCDHDRLVVGFSTTYAMSAYHH